MKKLLRFSSIIILCCSLNTVYSQCNPDFIYSLLAIPGIWPDATTGIDDATVNKSYSQTLTVIVPKDTSVDLANFGFPFSLVVPVNVSSFTVDGIDGLPSALSYQCGNPNCVYATGETGCLVINGTPDQSSSNQTYSLTINLTVAIDLNDYGLGVQSFRYPATGYQLYVRPSSNGIFTIYDTELHVISFNENELQFFSPVNSKYVFDLYDVLGQKIYSINIQSMKGLNLFELPKTIHGIAFYSMHNESKNISGKLYFK